MAASMASCSIQIPTSHARDRSSLPLFFDAGLTTTTDADAGVAAALVASHDGLNLMQTDGVARMAGVSRRHRYDLYRDQTTADLRRGLSRADGFPQRRHRRTGSPPDSWEQACSSRRPIRVRQLQRVNPTRGTGFSTPSMDHRAGCPLAQPSTRVLARDGASSGDRNRGTTHRRDLRDRRLAL